MKSKRVAILQSSYIPWKLYFDIINKVDEFILYDDTQFTKRDWRNRNKIKTSQGVTWLTIPVESKNKYTQNIIETQVVDSRWTKEHWKAICHSYHKSPYFNHFSPLFEDLYEQCSSLDHLSSINELFITRICEILNIRSQITHSVDYGFDHLHKTDRLVAICQKANANFYLTGPSAKNYLDESLFQSAGIQVEYIEYENYPEYPQPYPPFTHEVSIIDLILNTGHNAKNYFQEQRDD